MLTELFTYSDAVTLDEAEEVTLIAAAQAGDEDAKVRLLLAYGPALRSAVSTFTNGVRAEREPWSSDSGLGSAALEVSDAQGAAVVAFLELIASHDPEVSPRLAGRVRQVLAEALGGLYAEVMPWRVPSRTLKRFYGILKAADGDAEAAEAAAPDYGMSRETFRDVLVAVRGTGSLDSLLDEDWSDGLATSPVYSTTPVTDVEDAILVEVAFSAVDDEQERICRLSYGFTEYEPVADAEVAHRMGLTRPTVQRKRAKALTEMRKALGVTHAGSIA